MDKHPTIKFEQDTKPIKTEEIGILSLAHREHEQLMYLINVQLNRTYGDIAYDVSKLFLKWTQKKDTSGTK